MDSGVPFFTAEPSLLVKSVLVAGGFVSLLGYHGRLALREKTGMAVALKDSFGSCLNAVMALVAFAGGVAGSLWPFSFMGAEHRWAPLLSMFGASLYLCGWAFFFTARKALGEMTTPAVLVYEEHRLRTEGPYAVSRHPMYTSVLMMALGAFLLYRHTSALWVYLTLTAGFSWKARLEERLLARRFGETYAAYARSVPRFFPLGIRLFG